MIADCWPPTTGRFSGSRSPCTQTSAPSVTDATSNRSLPRAQRSGPVDAVSQLVTERVRQTLPPACSGQPEAVMGRWHEQEGRGPPAGALRAGAAVADEQPPVLLGFVRPPDSRATAGRGTLAALTRSDGRARDRTCPGGAEGHRRRAEEASAAWRAGRAPGQSAFIRRWAGRSVAPFDDAAVVALNDERATAAPHLLVSHP